ncbi:MAG: aminoacyl-tRNA hydrolase [Candidatus Adlerbacteria bacterium]|nr:aminoacyl-tRNA hydrolase [Candidatus Adlerbacteria bacterium]
MNWILVGLGNPGEEYKNTRHNVGREFLLDCVEDLPSASRRKAAVVTPDTFMNKSGSAVKPFIKSVKAAEQLVVLHDDLDLPVGTVKVSFGRGSAGHKGVESIERAIKTKNYIRVRIGISAGGKGGVVKKPDVLGTFKPSEAAELKKARKSVKDALDILLTEGLAKAMTEINAR